ncbi:30S ribosomal protein S2 [bacterium]|nr:30S ribosomal protein S2 [bacterium]
MTVSLQELFDAGCHLGHPREKWHPRMKPWIYGEQEGIRLLDLEKTAVQLEKARVRIQELKANKKNIVVVATKKQAAEMVRDLATQAELFYVVNRWPGGLITNWEQVRRSVRRMSEIETGLAGDKYKDLTKYERMLLEKELARLERLFGGLKNLRSKPDALFVVDVQKEKNAVAEAIKEKVEIIAMVDTNVDPSGIAIPIPTNDDAMSAIRLIVSEALGVRTVSKTVAKTEKSEVKEEKVKKVKAVKEDRVEKEEKTEKKEKKVAATAKKEETAKKSVAKTTKKKAAPAKKAKKATKASKEEKKD